MRGIVVSIFKSIRAFFHLRKDLSQGQINHSPIYTNATDDELAPTYHGIAAPTSKVCWSQLLSNYIKNSIELYIRSLKMGRPETIRLVFKKRNYYDELEPKIYLHFKTQTILLDYERLRYGRLIKRDAEVQKQCVRAAESDYIEFRHAVSQEEDIRKELTSISQIVERELLIPVSYRFEE